MAQLKRLTRAQKVLHSKLLAGDKPGATTNPVDLRALEDHGLIRFGPGGWELVADKSAQPVDKVSEEALRKLQRRFT